MSRPINPYIAGNPVGNTNAFVGRADILRDVVRVLRRPQDNAIVLYGQRRIGKTSVLQHLVSQLPTQGNYCPIYFDLQDKATLTLGQVVNELAQAIAHALKQTTPDLGEQPEITFRETWLPNVLQNLPKDTALVLLFDEFDVLAAPEAKQAGSAFFPYLRQILSCDPQRLNFIFVIGRNVDDLDNIALSLFKGVDTKRVSLLNQEDTQKLIRLSEANHSLNWSDETLEYVWQRTNGHAFLTQQLCSHVWEQAYDEAPETVPTATPDDVEAVLFEALDASRNTLEWLWNGLPPAERVVASALAEAGSKPLTESALEKLLHESGVRVVIRELQNAPRLLQEWDLLEPTDGGYRFRVELLRLWIEENKPLKRVQEELDRIDPAADSLYNASLSLYRNGMLDATLAPLHQAISLNPNHLGANQLLADILLAQGQVGEAREILERLYKYQPVAARPRLVQALLILAKEDNEDEQLKLYEQVLDLDAEQPEAKIGWQNIWQQRGDEAYKADNLETALSAYRTANLDDKAAKIEQEIRDRKFEVQLNTLKNSVQTKSYETALELARQLAKEYPEKRDWTDDLKRLEYKIKLAGLYQRALNALEKDDIQNARIWLAQVIRLEPTYEEASRYLHLAVTGVDTFQLQQKLQQRPEDFQKLQNQFKKEKQEYKQKELKVQLESKREFDKRKIYNSIVLGLLSVILMLITYPLTLTTLEYLEYYVVSFLSYIAPYQHIIIVTFILIIFGVLGGKVLLPRWYIRREDAGRTVKLLIYESLDDPAAIFPSKTVYITGQVRCKLDGQVNVQTPDGILCSAKYFRITRTPNQGIPRVIVEYRWAGESKDKPYALVLSGKEIAKPLQGLPSGNNIVVGLNY